MCVCLSTQMHIWTKRKAQKGEFAAARKNFNAGNLLLLHQTVLTHSISENDEVVRVYYTWSTCLICVYVSQFECSSKYLVALRWLCERSVPRFGLFYSILFIFPFFPAIHFGCAWTTLPRVQTMQLKYTTISMFWITFSPVIIIVNVYSE